MSVISIAADPCWDDMEARMYESSLLSFVEHFWPYIESQSYIPNWHIELICDHLQAVTEGRIKNLLINIPPGCSKSLLCCVFWPCWEWTRDASKRWFFASYDQRLSIRDSVKCRVLIRSNEYQRFWGGSPNRLNPPHRFYITHDQNQKVYYETSRGGYRLATSVGGHGTGQHPDRIVVDDPISAKDAESEIERQSVIDWWDLTMSTRGVARGASRVIIMQRLHEKDLAGHVLSSDDSFEHICLCMRHESGRMPFTSLGLTDNRKEEGELLTPNQFSDEAVKKMEKNLGAYGVAGQLQQRPRPKGGGMFKEKWFNQRIKAAPYNARRIRYWDRAATQDGGCYTAGVLIAQSSDGKYFIEDCVHGQWEPDERNEIMRATALKDRSRYGPNYEPEIFVEQEGGSSGVDAWKGVVRALVGFRVMEDRPTGSKDVRAEPWSSELAAGNVWIVDNGESEGNGKATWDINGYIKEHTMFKPEPGKRLGKYKDQVDASSGAYNLFAGAKRVQPLRVYTFARKAKHARMLVCSKDELATLILDTDKCLLVSIRDPLEPQETPVHGIRHLLDVHHLEFADVDLKDHQNTWDELIAPFDKAAKEICITSNMGRDLWKFLFKQRQHPYEVIVIQGSGDRRALSVACGIADVLRIPRKSCIHMASSDDIDIEGLPRNQYIIDQVKASRERLVT